MIVVLSLVLLSLARFTPSYAVSSLDLSPASVSTGESVTVTVTQVVGPGPDVFASLQVTDPLGNVFGYDGAPFSVSSGHPLVVSFPDPTKWTMVSGPGGNTGTNVSGTYHVKGTYLDTSLSVLLGHFVVLSASGSFKVPEFSQSTLLLVGVALPALLLVRRMSPKTRI